MSDAVIHAVLATAPGVNVGMAAVELGLISVAREAGVQLVPRRHPALVARRDNLPDAADIARRMDVGLGGAIPLESLPAPDEGRLLYWGDFQHMRQYIEAVARADNGTVESVHRLLLADGAAPATLQRTQSFGSTLLFNSAEDLACGAYRGALTRFIDGCAEAWFRDAISTTMARRFTSRGHVRLGVDGALLAEPPAQDAGESHIAVFLGRTPAAHPALLEAAHRLGRHFDSRCRWLDWGCSRAFPALASAEVRRNLGQKPDAPGALEVLQQLRGAEAVVTDSYHVALISWAWGIPAVTVAGFSDPAIPSSVDGGRLRSWRDKRELAASQYGSLELLLRPEEWGDRLRLMDRIDSILAALDDGLMGQIQRSIAWDAARARRELLASWSQPVEVSIPRPPAVSSSSMRGRVRAAAVVVVRNELHHIDGLIRQLVLDGLDVVVVDHGSTDGSRERALGWQGRGVLWVEQRRFDGVFSLRDQLRWKEEVFHQLHHDWLMHVDADEWPQAQNPGERLVDLFSRADRMGATAVNFEEFTFVPDVELPAPCDPREVFCTYYHFAPKPLRLMRAWRADAGLVFADAGHRLEGANLSVYREHGLLRHYPTLSAEHASEKYVGRRYAEAEVALGWHSNRIGMAADDFELRPSGALRRLERWESREFQRSAPVRYHFWERGWSSSAGADGANLPVEPSPHR